MSDPDGIMHYTEGLTHSFNEFQMMLRNSAKLVSNSLNTSKRLWMQELPIRNFASSTSPLVNVEVNDSTGIATVTMNRKPVNGLSLDLLEALSNRLDDLEKNKTRGAILTSV